MPTEIRIAIIGLDTSHSVEFPRLMQAPDCSPEIRIEGLRATRCLRFETPFQNKDGLNQRQKQLEEWGVLVTEDFDEAIEDCDAIMLEINDQARHLEYFAKCAGLGKPIFIDKPLADSSASGRKIAEIASTNGTRWWSSSSLRFVSALTESCAKVASPKMSSVYGPLGIAPAGSSIIWYGCHAFEMVQRAIGHGAVAVTSLKDKAGVVCVVEYGDDRRGVVELTEGNYQYGGCLRGETVAPFVADVSKAYWEQLKEIAKFFRGGEAPLTVADILEVMDMLDAADRSAQSGAKERLVD
jgi:predicted dehydrogenase